MSLNYSSIEKALKEKGFVVVPTVGKSMRPLLKTDKTTVLIKSDYKPLKKYDVILFKSFNKTYVLHRILKLKEDFVVTSGDSQYVKEEVPYSQIIGKMTKYYLVNKEKEINTFKYKLYVFYVVVTRPIKYILWMTKRVYRRLFRRKTDEKN